MIRTSRNSVDEPPYAEPLPDGRAAGLDVDHVSLPVRALEGSVLYFERRAGGALNLSFRPGQFLLTFASAFLGFYRVVAFHPTLRGDYFEWLKLTPWTVQKPLPLGPIELVPEDALVMGGLLLLSLTQPTPNSINFVNTFILINLSMLTISLIGKSVPGFVYGGFLLLGAVPQLRTSPWVGLAVLVGTYLFVHEGLWRVLVRFPGGKAGAVPESREDINRKAIGPSCGWPFNRLHGDPRRAKSPRRLQNDLRGVFPTKSIDAALACLLGIWWAWSLFSLFDDRDQRMKTIAFAVVLIICLAPLIRIAMYVNGYPPPISFWGRLRTFRWIIPGYDQVFVGPICSVLGAVLVLSFLGTPWMPVDICLVIAASVSVFLALVVPPDLRRWYLTGHHRLAQTQTESKEANIPAGAA